MRIGIIGTLGGGHQAGDRQLAATCMFLSGCLHCHVLFGGDSRSNRACCLECLGSNSSRTGRHVCTRAKLLNWRVRRWVSKRASERTGPRACGFFDSLNQEGRNVGVLWPKRPCIYEAVNEIEIGRRRDSESALSRLHDVWLLLLLLLVKCTCDTHVFWKN
jgi:hypothetical protein